MAWEISVLLASGPGDAALETIMINGQPQPRPPPGTGATIDGFPWASMNVGTRVLLLNQGGSPGAPARSNGVWVFQGVYPALMTRPSSPDPYATDALLDDETVIRVSLGTAHAHTEWVCVTPGGGVRVDTTPLAHSRQLVRANVKDFGARGDGRTVTDGSMNTGSPRELTCSTSQPFTAADVSKSVRVVGADENGGDLVTTIGSVSSSSVAILNADCSTSVSGAMVQYGRDDSAAIASAISSMSTAGGAILFPPGTYAVGEVATVAVPANVQITFEEGAMLMPLNRTVTVNGRVAAHPTQQIFGGAGVAIVQGGVTHTGSGPAMSIPPVGNPLGGFSFKVQVVGPIDPSTVAIALPGAGYSQQTQVLFSPPEAAAGITATGKVTVSSGQVTGITVTNPGSGYASRPDITFVDPGVPPGMGAKATVQLKSPAGGLGTMTFCYSLDGGATWSRSVTSEAGSSYVYTFPSTGVTATFNSGTYFVGDTYTWTSTPAVILTKAASDRLSVKWWGARGDNLADDTAAIISAIWGCVSEGVANASVFLPPGNYKVTSPISISVLGTRVLGESYSATNIRVAFTDTRAAVFALAAHSIAVRDLTIWPSSEAYNHQWCGFSFASCSAVVIDNCIIRYPYTGMFLVWGECDWLDINASIGPCAYAGIDFWGDLVNPPYAFTNGSKIRILGEITGPGQGLPGDSYGIRLGGMTCTVDGGGGEISLCKWPLQLGEGNTVKDVFVENVDNGPWVTGAGNWIIGGTFGGYTPHIQGGGSISYIGLDGTGNVAPSTLTSFPGPFTILPDIQLPGAVSGPALSGLKPIMASAVAYGGPYPFGAGMNLPVVFDTPLWDPLGCIVTTGTPSWYFRCPVAGVYRISATLNITWGNAAGTVFLQAWTGGAAIRGVGAYCAASNINGATLVTEINCSAGQAIWVQLFNHTAGTVTLDTANFNQWVHIEKIGGS